ncbi:hypothetical protein ABW19_dt0204126 [Dactylella cylindrospora]|nr:hypothetical protein ABW19_dt0204126 [Dactylella cylindrospora]
MYIRHQAPFVSINYQNTDFPTGYAPIISYWWRIILFRIRTIQDFSPSLPYGRIMKHVKRGWTPQARNRGALKVKAGKIDKPASDPPPQPAQKVSIHSKPSSN